MLASVNLGGSTATFATDAGVQAAMPAGAIAGAPKTTSAANAHFLTQGLALLSANIWFSQSTDSGGQTHTFILPVDANGKYVQIETGPDELQGSSVAALSGVEAGTLSVAGFSPEGFNMTANIATHSNGQWGASNLQSCDRLRNIGEQLVTIDCESSRSTFGKMQNVAGTIVGAWLRPYQENGITKADETYYFANTSRPVTYSLSADGSMLTLDGRTDRMRSRISK